MTIYSKPAERHHKNYKLNKYSGDIKYPESFDLQWDMFVASKHENLTGSFCGGLMS